jgi:hypothetical protein
VREYLEFKQSVLVPNLLLLITLGRLPVAVGLTEQVEEGPVENLIVTLKVPRSQQAEGPVAKLLNQSIRGQLVDLI